MSKIGIALAVPGLLLTLPGVLVLLPALKRIARRMDYAEYGGAPLLGVDGVVIIAHGRSNAKAIKNAVRVARDSARVDLVGIIKEGLARERDVQQAEG